MKNIKTIVIVDDQYVEDLKILIEKNNKANIKKIITFNSREGFIKALTRGLEYDILLLDHGMPENLTIKNTKEFAEKYNPQAIYILISNDISDKNIQQILIQKYGFSEFIDKKDCKEKLKKYL